MGGGWAGGEWVGGVVGGGGAGVHARHVEVVREDDADEGGDGAVAASGFCLEFFAQVGADGDAEVEPARGFGFARGFHLRFWVGLSGRERCLGGLATPARGWERGVIFGRVCTHLWVKFF